MIASESSTRKSAYTNTKIFDGEEFHYEQALLVEADKVIGLVSNNEIPSDYETIVLNNGLITSGFIDLQVNGGGGVLFNNMPTATGLQEMSQAHLKLGTTSIMPTVISDTIEVTRQCVSAVQANIKSNRSLLGIHIEGPFFNLKRRGVHKSDFIRKLSDEDLQFLSRIENLSVMLTLAPEQVTLEQIQKLYTAGIKLLAGHSNANYQQIYSAVEQGLTGFTHLYNAMTAASAREPAIVGAALSLDKTTASIIADGYHVHPEMIKLAYRCKPRGKLILVSDAMASVGGTPEFRLYEQIIREENGRIINQEGNLAGSAIALIDAVKIAIEQCQIPVDEALKMASLYPANYIGVADRLGKLAPGYEADFVHFDSHFNIINVWKSGEIIKDH